MKYVEKFAGQKSKKGDILFHSVSYDEGKTFEITDLSLQLKSGEIFFDIEENKISFEFDFNADEEYAETFDGCFDTKYRTEMFRKAPKRQNKA